MLMHMHYNTFDPADPISVLNFLSTSKMTYDSNEELEGAAMWLLHLIICNLATSIVNTRTRPCEWSKKSVEGAL